jgi:hypothetical protein
MKVLSMVSTDVMYIIKGTTVHILELQIIQQRKLQMYRHSAIW